MYDKDGFCLNKFTAYPREVIESVPEECRTTDVKERCLCHDYLSAERVIGVQ